MRKELAPETVNLKSVDGPQGIQNPELYSKALHIDSWVCFPECSSTSTFIRFSEWAWGSKENEKSYNTPASLTSQFCSGHLGL